MTAGFATVNHYLKLLKAIFNRAIRPGRLTYNPVAAGEAVPGAQRAQPMPEPRGGDRLMEALPARSGPS